MTELSCYRPGVLVEPRFDGDYTHNTGKIKIFTILDYFIFMLSLLIPIIIGFYQGWRRHNSMDFAEYMLARRSILPSCRLVIVSHLSVSHYGAWNTG